MEGSRDVRSRPPARNGVATVPERIRSLLGAVILLVFIPTYVLFAVAFAAVLLPETGAFTQFAYYLVAGLLWVIPAGAIIYWMFRPKARRA
jgi:hypothetical protein